MTETELEYQFCFNCNDRKNCYTKPKDCTRIQEEIGLQEMTNEEWFCGLSTEEKAKFIFWQHFDVYGKTIYELMVNASKGVSRDKQAEVMIGAVVEWLKEIHK